MCSGNGSVNRCHFILPALAVCLCLSCSPDRADNTPTTIRFAYQNRIGSAIPIVAVEKGYFKHQGIAVESLRFNSGPSCAEALVSGAADIGTMGDSTALIAVARYPHLKIIASHSTGEHRHRLMVLDRSPYQSIQDLTGKRVAVKKGTSTHGGLLAALVAHQMSPADLKLVDLSPATMPNALISGSIDAIAASEPTPSLVELNGARELATFGGLNNNYPILILSNDGFLNDHAELIRGFFKALKSAEAFIQSHPDDAAALLAAATGLPPAAARQAMKRHRYRLALDTPVISSLTHTAGFLRTQNKIETLPDLTESATRRFLITPE